jgi:hypothetical protein
MNIQKLNKDITWQDVYNAVKNKQMIIFTATREEIEFNNVEQEFKSVNFNFPFALDTLAIPTIQEIFAYEAIGMVQISPITRIRLLTKLLGGQILYERIGTGDEWKLIISF